MTKPTQPSVTQSQLGQHTNYPKHYDPGQLFPIPRAESRATLGHQPHWIGADIWTAFEVSWLDPKGKPVVAIASFSFDQGNPNLIESKSFKLYLNSFNQSHFQSAEEVVAHWQTDLSKACGGHVDIHLALPLAWADTRLIPLKGDCVDHLEVTIQHYQPQASLLRCAEHKATDKGSSDGTDVATVAEGNATTGAAAAAEAATTEATAPYHILYSNLLRSNCPVTNQPDWGTVVVAYRGPRLDPQAFLQYIVSYREHNGFHELCVEQIYGDILSQCQPEELFVMARYTRRGGLDINPWRASHQRIANAMQELREPFGRLARQ